jgi:CRP/FNR family transcriptional regulator, cyclic AMP receptor protein
VYEELLAQVPLFRELSRRELAWLAEGCREREYAPGEDVMRRGSFLGAGLVIVRQGAVSRRRSEEEPERIGGGAALGEETLLDEVPSLATVTALEATQAVVLPTWQFRSIVREFPDLALHLLAVLGQRLRRAEELVARERILREADAT